MSNDTLSELIVREELTYVQQFVFERESDARSVYSAMLADDVPVPLKCAIALMRSITFDWWAVVLFIGRSFRITEMPKPIDVSFSWQEYLDKLGLARQSEWNHWKANDFPGFNRAFGDAVVVDYFLSPGLKGAGYKCLACGETFPTYDKLFDGHVFGAYGHDREFNAALLAQLVQEAVGEADSVAAALSAARKLVPANAEVIEEKTTEAVTTQHKWRASSRDSAEAAFAKARGGLPKGVRVTTEDVTRPGGMEEVDLKLELKDDHDSTVSMAVRDYFRFEQPYIKGVLQAEWNVTDYVCTRKGSRGLFGIGKRPSEYHVKLSLPWEVVVNYETDAAATARIRYRVRKRT